VDARPASACARDSEAVAWGAGRAPACQILRTEPPSASPDYVERVNRATDLITARPAAPHRLEEVAAAAGFSPFHFHRVFRSLTGETLQRFVRRVRLERALRLMAHGASGRTLTETALDCGFTSSSDFSRAFKARFGVPPSAFDLDAWREERRDELVGLFDAHAPGPRLERLPAGENPDGFEARTRRVPARDVAYVRVLDPFRGGVTEAAERLVDWAERRGHADRPWYGYMWEDPDVVPLADCRYDVAVEVPAGTRASGEVGRTTFPAMTIAEVDVAGPIDLEQRALDWLYGTWLPRSGREPLDAPCFEAWRGRPFAHGHEHFELSVQLPLR